MNSLLIILIVDLRVVEAARLALVWIGRSWLNHHDHTLRNSRQWTS